MKQTPYEQFVALATHHARPVIQLCRFALKQEQNPAFPCRDFLSRLNRAASRLQEMVDAHGAQTNERWFPFREAIAAAKNFSGVTYDVLHIQQSIPRYRLLSEQSPCSDATAAAIATLRDTLLTTARTILDRSTSCGVEVSDDGDDFRPCDDEPVAFRLETDRAVRHIDRIGEQVVYLATQFLNITEDRDVADVLQDREPEDYDQSIPDPISEERMRIVEARFHNLQSQYDTYIFESDLEQQNSQLRFLRGHVSIIYHLLAVGTDLVHFYIRHMSTLRRGTQGDVRFPIEPERLKNLIFDYPLRYAREFMESAVHLCQGMIQDYSEQAEIEVPIPNYRGFHVRPSTLVARIVLHYGSRVTMILDGQEYDAAAPLELFRANEAINRAKRQRIAEMLSERPELQVPVPRDFEKLVRELQLIFVRLMNQDEIVMYDTDLSFTDLEADGGTTMAELVARSVRHFMSIAKVDVQSDMTVRFVGDSRALKDLRILAEHGYGEDRMGNNTVLPQELAYLSR